MQDRCASHKPFEDAIFQLPGRLWTRSCNRFFRKPNAKCLCGKWNRCQYASGAVLKALRHVYNKVSSSITSREQRELQRRRGGIAARPTAEEEAAAYERHVPPAPRVGVSRSGGSFTRAVAGMGWPGIHGVLTMLGIEISDRTGRAPSTGWRLPWARRRT